jgi:hypothetical protein
MQASPFCSFIAVIVAALAPKRYATTLELPAPWEQRCFAIALPLLSRRWQRKRLCVVVVTIQLSLLGNGYSVLLAVCSAICPASFWSRSANLYGAEHFGEWIDFF